MPNPDIIAAHQSIRELEGKLVGMVASYVEQMQALELIAIGEHQNGEPLSAEDMRAIARAVFFKTEQ